MVLADELKLKLRWCLVFVGLYGVLLCLVSVPAFAEIVWSEEFEAGPLPDSGTWSHDLGASGWGNNELQAYTTDPANAHVKDGRLIITVRATEGRAGFTSARLRTQDKFTFLYGSVEARIRTPDLADGLWPAFWLLGNSFGRDGWPDCGEIDVMEMGAAAAIREGVVNRRVGSAAHWEISGNHALDSAFADASVDLNDGFHLYRLDWTPTSVSTYVDGNPVWSMDITPDACNDCAEFHRPHFIILNVAVGGDYTQRYAPQDITASLPAKMLVDYIRVIDNGFTELGGSSIPSP